MNSLIDNVSSSYVLLILGMALVTYLIRAAVFVFGDKIAFPPLVRTALSFVPVTVLTAIIVPMTVSPHGNGAELTWRNAQLVAAIVAIGVCVATRRPLLTIAVSLAVFFFWQLVVLA
ncbi:branched-chain amino acid transport [Caballeronia choica]|uniref:Branched-chain amino acid transport n=1 Tax=Caballeronia choica TaxID=326476 RepID=A0A158F973_9BURK|nr:AzlD domain-containing protein [Caballeronia choica]SAL16287.1 branched-chain amino acid transport [Caballeronia choica]